MIVLCLALIAYDILVLIDPTRCFLLSCANANVTYVVNSTFNATTSGWPLNITYPDYFQSNMTYKRIFQGIQIFCAALFILFCALYILTFIIYRRIKLHHQTVYHADQHTHETTIVPTKHIDHIVQSYPQYGHHHSITMYHIDAHYTSSSAHYDHSPLPVEVKTTKTRKTKITTMLRPRANSVNYDRMCTRCMKEPRMNLKSNFERQNFYSHLCTICNNELLIGRQKPPYVSHSRDNHSWKP
jgi:hypothetical protein